MTKLYSDKPLLLFDDLAVGREYAPLIFPLSREVVDHFLDLMGDDNPLYHSALPLLEGLSLRGRAEALISVADPAFQDRLRETVQLVSRTQRSTGPT